MAKAAKVAEAPVPSYIAAHLMRQKTGHHIPFVEKKEAERTRKAAEQDRLISEVHRIGRENRANAMAKGKAEAADEAVRQAKAAAEAAKAAKVEQAKADAAALVEKAKAAELTAKHLADLSKKAAEEAKALKAKADKTAPAEAE